MAGTPSVQFERRRTVWDVVLGILSIVAGVIAVGHAALASLVSVLFLGWMLIIGGISLLVSGIAGWKQPGHRSDVVIGALLAILGFGLVRNPGAGVLVLTLLAGSLLLVGGIVRLGAAFQPDAPRAVLLLNGVVTVLLGAMVLFRWPLSALWFLGTILGIQLILDGVTTAIVGRVRLAPVPEPGPAPDMPPAAPV